MKALLFSSLLAPLFFAVTHAVEARVGEKIGDYIARVEKAGWKRMSEDPHPSGMIAYHHERGAQGVMVYALNGVISAERFLAVKKESIKAILDAQGSGKWEKVFPDFDFWRDTKNPLLVANFTAYTKTLFISDGNAIAAMRSFEKDEKN